MNRSTTKAQVVRAFVYAGQLRQNSMQNPAFPSLLAHRAAADTDYALASAELLIRQANNVLRNARLTTFPVTTKAEAVAVILGISRKPR